MVKKFFVLVISVILMFSLISCGDNTSEKVSNSDSTNNSSLNSNDENVENDESFEKEEENTNTEDDSNSENIGDSAENTEAPIEENVGNDETNLEGVLDENSSEKENEDSKMPVKASDIFSINGTDLKIGMKMSKSIVSSLGETIDIQTAPSCQYDGEDTIYMYEDFSLYTYADADDEILYMIEILGEGVTISEGLKVGDTLETVKNTYEKPTDETAFSITYETSTSLLTFYIDDASLIEGIEYAEK